MYTHADRQCMVTCNGWSVHRPSEITGDITLDSQDAHKVQNKWRDWNRYKFLHRPYIRATVVNVLWPELVSSHWTLCCTADTLICTANWVLGNDIALHVYQHYLAEGLALRNFLSALYCWRSDTAAHMYQHYLAEGLIMRHISISIILLKGW